MFGKRVKAVGKGASNAAAIGARFTITAGDKQYLRKVQAGNSGNQNPLIAHIGLGNHTGPVDIAVRFPSGKTVMTRPCVIALSPRVNHEVGRQRCVPAPRAVRLFNGANKYTAIRTTIDVRAPRRQVPIGAL